MVNVLSRLSMRYYIPNRFVTVENRIAAKRRRSTTALGRASPLSITKAATFDITINGRSEAYTVRSK